MIWFPKVLAGALALAQPEIGSAVYCRSELLKTIRRAIAADLKVCGAAGEGKQKDDKGR